MDREVGPIETGLRSSGSDANKKHRLKSRFQVVRKLGQGTYGKVQLAINKETGQEVAIKTIKKSKIESEQDLVRIRREIQIMSSITHPHIIHIFEVFENKEKIVLVMQHASGGELYEYVSDRKLLTDQEARRLFRQIATAIYYCHKNQVCHRDLKLENILMDDKSNAKIGDFGLSNVFDSKHHLTTFCGSPLYASPEIVKGTPYFGPEVDCWSMGVLLYTLVYGAMPFDGSNFKRLVKQISEANYFEPKDRKSEASPLIRRLLCTDPRKRATIVDICNDSWVNQGFDHSLLQVAEDLANLTPVRLDILLSLAPISPTSQSNNNNNLSAVRPATTTTTPGQGKRSPSVTRESRVDASVIDVDSENNQRNKGSGGKAPAAHPAVNVTTAAAGESPAEKRKASTPTTGRQQVKQQAKPTAAQIPVVTDSRTEDAGSAFNESPAGQEATTIKQPEAVSKVAATVPPVVPVPQSKSGAAAASRQPKSKVGSSDQQQPSPASGQSLGQQAATTSSRQEADAGAVVAGIAVKGGKGEQEVEHQEECNNNTIISGGGSSSPPDKRRRDTNQAAEAGDAAPVVSIAAADAAVVDAVVVPKGKQISPQQQSPPASSSSLPQVVKDESEKENHAPPASTAVAAAAISVTSRESIQSPANPPQSSPASNAAAAAATKPPPVTAPSSPAPPSTPTTPSTTPAAGQAEAKAKPRVFGNIPNRRKPSIQSSGAILVSSASSPATPSTPASASFLLSGDPSSSQSPVATIATTGSTGAPAVTQSDQQSGQQQILESVPASTAPTGGKSHELQTRTPSRSSPPSKVIWDTNAASRDAAVHKSTSLKAAAKSASSQPSPRSSKSPPSDGLPSAHDQQSPVVSQSCPQSPHVSSSSSSSPAATKTASPRPSLTHQTSAEAAAATTRSGSGSPSQSPSTLRRRKQQEEALIARRNSFAKRVGRLSIPSFLELQKQGQQGQQQQPANPSDPQAKNPKLGDLKKRVPSYGSIEEAKKKLLQRADSVTEPQEREHVFPTIPVQEATVLVERRASALDEPIELTKGPTGIRFDTSQPPEPSIIRGVARRMQTQRRATEPLATIIHQIHRQNEQQESKGLEKDDSQTSGMNEGGSSQQEDSIRESSLEYECESESVSQSLVTDDGSTAQATGTRQEDEVSERQEAMDSKTRRGKAKTKTDDGDKGSKGADAQSVDELSAGISGRRTDVSPSVTGLDGNAGTKTAVTAESYSPSASSSSSCTAPSAQASSSAAVAAAAAAAGAASPAASRPAPITRSYKKVTFTKEGAKIMETGKVICQPGPDGVMTRIEKKSRVVHHPGSGAADNPKQQQRTTTTTTTTTTFGSSPSSSLDQQVNRESSSSIPSSASQMAMMRESGTSSPLVPGTGISHLLASSSSSLRRSESASSSGSTDVFDDIFDTWSGDRTGFPSHDLMSMVPARMKSLFSGFHQQQQQQPMSMSPGIMSASGITPSNLFMRRSNCWPGGSSSRVRAESASRGSAGERRGSRSGSGSSLHHQRNASPPPASTTTTTSSSFFPDSTTGDNDHNVLSSATPSAAGGVRDLFQELENRMGMMGGGGGLFSSPSIMSAGTHRNSLFHANNGTPIRGGGSSASAAGTDPFESSEGLLSCDPSSFFPGSSGSRISRLLIPSSSGSAAASGSAGGTTANTSASPSSSSTIPVPSSSSSSSSQPAGLLFPGLLTPHHNQAFHPSNMLDSDPLSRPSATWDEDPVILPESSSLLDQLRTHGYRNLVNQRIAFPPDSLIRKCDDMMPCSTPDCSPSAMNPGLMMTGLTGGGGTNGGNNGNNGSCNSNNNLLLLNNNNGSNKSPPNEESVRDRIHRKSFFQRFNDDGPMGSMPKRAESLSRRESLTGSSPASKFK